MLEHSDDPPPPSPDDVASEAVRARLFRHPYFTRRLLVGVVLTAAIALLVPSMVLAFSDHGGQRNSPKATGSSAPATETSSSRGTTTARVSSTTAPGALAAHSGVRGVAVRGPACPVEGTGHTCGAQPIEATVQVRGRSSGATTVEIRTGNDGRFKTALAPGRYVLRVIRRPETEDCESIELTVPSGRYADVTVTCDTGIR